MHILSTCWIAIEHGDAMDRVQSLDGHRQLERASTCAIQENSRNSLLGGGRRRQRSVLPVPSKMERRLLTELYFFSTCATQQSSCLRCHNILLHTVVIVSDTTIAGGDLSQFLPIKKRTAPRLQYWICSFTIGARHAFLSSLRALQPQIRPVFDFATACLVRAIHG